MLKAEAPSASAPLELAPQFPLHLPTPLYLLSSNHLPYFDFSNLHFCRLFPSLSSIKINPEGSKRKTRGSVLFCCEDGGLPPISVSHTVAGAEIPGDRQEALMLSPTQPLRPKGQGCHLGVRIPKSPWVCLVCSKLGATELWFSSSGM